VNVAGPPAPESLRSDQADRRKRIVHTALRTLVNSEYERIKISDVARDSGVALGTVYRYFASKEHLFAAVYAEWQGTLKDKLERATPDGGLEQDRLRGVIHLAIRAFQRQPQFFRLVMVLQATDDAFAKEIFTSLGSVFIEMVDPLFDITPVADRPAVLHTVEAVMVNYVQTWVTNRGTIEDAYQAVDDAIRLIYDFPKASSRKPSSVTAATARRVPRDATR
jgi:AcrR family transcriptional regulator